MGIGEFQAGLCEEGYWQYPLSHRIEVMDNDLVYVQLGRDYLVQIMADDSSLSASVFNFCEDRHLESLTRLVDSSIFIGWPNMDLHQPDNVIAIPDGHKGVVEVAAQDRIVTVKNGTTSEQGRAQVSIWVQPELLVVSGLEAVRAA